MEIKEDLIFNNKPKSQGPKLYLESNYAFTAKSGFRYPKLSLLEDDFRYNLSLWDSFFELVYEDEFKKNLNIVWPYRDSEMNKRLAREMIIDQIGKRATKGKGTQITLSGIAKQNLDRINARLNTVSTATNSINLDDYMQIVRQQAKEQEAAENSNDSSNGSFMDKIPLFIRKNILRILIGLVASATTIGTIIYTADKGSTSWEEAEGMLDLDTLLKLMPDQSDKIGSFTVSKIGLSNPTLKKQEEKVNNILTEDGTRGVLKHYLDVSEKIESGDYTYEELCDYYATSFNLPQVIVYSQFSQAMNEYLEQHPEDTTLSQNIESLSTHVRYNQDITDPYVLVDFDDGSYSTTQLLDEKDRVKVTDENGKTLEDDLPDIFTSFTSAESAFSSGDKTSLAKETKKVAKKTRKYLDQLTKQVRFYKKGFFDLLAQHEYGVDKKNIPENKFRQDYGE